MIPADHPIWTAHLHQDREVLDERWVKGLPRPLLRWFAADCVEACFCKVPPDVGVVTDLIRKLAMGEIDEKELREEWRELSIHAFYPHTGECIESACNVLDESELFVLAAAEQSIFAQSPPWNPFMGQGRLEASSKEKRSLVQGQVARLQFLCKAHNYSSRYLQMLYDNAFPTDILEAA